MTSTIAQLLAKAHTYRDDLGRRPHQNARKALIRIAQAAGRHPTEVTCDDVVAAHDAATTGSSTISTKHKSEERTHLRRLIDLPDIDPALAGRVFAGTATLRDAYTLMCARGDRPTRVSAVKKMLEHLEKVAPNRELRADAVTIEKRLAAITFTDLGVTRSTWASYQSAVRRAVALVDMHGQERFSATMLTGDWATLIATTRAMKREKPRSGAGHYESKVWPLVKHCQAFGIAAADVNDATIQALGDELERLDRSDPKSIVQAVVYGWEGLQRLLPDVWPATRLSRIYSKGQRTFRTPYQALPEALRASWETYADAHFAAPGSRAADPGRLSDLVCEPSDVGDAGGDQAYDDPLAAELDDAPETDVPSGTVVVRRCAKARGNMRTTVTYLANAAIHERGFTPTSLEDLLTRDTRGVMNRAIALLHMNQQRLADARGSARPSLRNSTTRRLVSDALAIARDIGLPAETITAIDTFYDKVHPDFLGWRPDPKTGKLVRIWDDDFRMSPRRQRMIARFSETGGKERLLAWARLPVIYRGRGQDAIRRVRGEVQRLTEEELCDATTAVVAAIVRCGALRRGSLETLRIADHPEDRDLVANLYIPVRQKKDIFARFDLAPIDIKKNGRAIHLLGDTFTTEALVWFRDHIRPELLRRRGSDPRNPFLFPGPGLRPRPEGKATRDYGRRARRLGFTLDLHTNRALIGKVILDRDPGQMELVQQALGHKDVETTRNYYAFVNTLVAQKAWHAHIEAAERETYETLGAATLRLAK
jgi:integrase